MNRILALGLPLAAIALLAACGRGEPEDAAVTDGTQTADLGPSAPAQPAPDTGDRPLTLDLGDGRLDATVAFAPEIAAQPALYDSLREQAEAEIAEARQIAAEDAAARAGIDAPFNPHFLNIEWRADFDNDRVLSLLKRTGIFQGGAHPNLYFDVTTWDKAAQARIGAADLFAGGAWAALSPAAEQAIMAEKRARLGKGLPDENYWKQDVVYATAPAAENFELFTLVPAQDNPAVAGGIAIHYPPYAVGPYVEGDYHIVIPQSVFADYVQPDYAGLFGGEPAN